MTTTTASHPSAAIPTRADDRVFRDATILIVDDHPQNLLLFERIFQRAGVSHIHVTMDPTTAADMCTTLDPDLILLDLHMPGMDGVAVMQALASGRPAGAFVPVIVLTADATTEARDRVLAAGASDFLTKPVDRTEVLLRARNLLHTRALHAELAQHNAMLQSEISAAREAEAIARAEAAAKTRRVQAVLDRGGPRLVYQPVVHLGSGRVVGHEALARFDGDPPRPPNHWFDEAGEVGLGADLELAAISAALADLDRLPGDTFLSLNVSPRVVLDRRFADRLAGLPPERIVLEVTEHARVDDYERLHAALAPLRAGGIRLAVDDAGAGFASLKHILQLQPDIIKLDITLSRDIDADPVKRALAAALVAFGHEIDGTLIAEGIETSEEQAVLTSLGVTHGQGYHLGRPQPLR